MDGIAKTVGAPTTVKLRGKTYVLGTLELTDFGTIENHLLANRRNLIREAAQTVYDMPEELKQAMGDRVLDRAMARTEKNSQVSYDEIGEWLDTRPGLAFTMWIMLNKENPGIFDLEEMDEIFSEMTDAQIEELKDRRDQATNIPTDSEAKKNEDAGETEATKAEQPAQ